MKTTAKRLGTSHRRLLWLFASLALALAAACSKEEPLGSLPGSSNGCPDDLEYFEQNIWNPILSVKCIGCHNSDGIASKTRMVLDPPEVEGYLEHNFRTVKALAEVTKGGTPVLLLRPTGKYPSGHSGGTLFSDESTYYKDLQTFISRVTLGEKCDQGSAKVQCADKVPAPGRRQLRRLTRMEYDSSIHDLLGIESTFGEKFAPDVVVDGFDNNAGALNVSALLADQLRDAAEQLAATAMQSGALNRYADPNCDAATSATTCAQAVIEDFGLHAFRRPLSDTEVARYNSLFDAGYADPAPGGSAYDSGLELVLTAMLQSPGFLYRLELGSAGADGLFELDGYEVATELAYLIWGTTPDDELLTAAANGDLDSPDGIKLQATRLLSDERALTGYTRFVDQWLGLTQLDTVQKDPATYPELDPSIRAALAEETKQFIRYVLDEKDGRLDELLTAPYSFLSPELATYYGVSAPAGAGFSQVDFADGQHAGLLTQGSVLVTHSMANSSSPIHRGKLVRERLLCQKLSPPPPNIVVEVPPVDPSASNRERFSVHSANEPCKSCHRLIDPIGFGFEHFDGIGRFQADDRGFPIDTKGEILATDNTDTTFEGVPELGAILADSSDVQSCVALQWYRWGYAQEETDETTCTAQAFADRFAANELRLPELILALVEATHFRTRTLEAGVDEPVDPGTGGSGGSGNTGAGGSGAGGSGNAGTGGATNGGSGSGGSNPVSSDVSVEDKLDSQWDSGSCHTVNVTNTGGANVTWTIELDVAGTLDNYWNAVATASGSKTRFSGVDFNRTLAPGEVASFGYCKTN
ncbi:MAG: DUF1592 domain-containing protein [Polyangiaceae bacterium]